VNSIENAEKIQAKFLARERCALCNAHDMKEEKLIPSLKETACECKRQAIPELAFPRKKYKKEEEEVKKGYVQVWQYNSTAE
jgi:hypothetical protein